MSNPRTFFLGIVGAVALVVAAWFFFVFQPKGDEIGDVERQIDEAQAQESSLRTRLQRLEALDRERPALEAQVRRLTAAVPPDPELASFILAIHDLATRTELGFAQLTPALPVADEQTGASAIAVSMQVEGDFFSVVEFLDRLQELERILVVDSLNLAARGPEIPTEPQDGEDGEDGGGVSGAGVSEVDVSEVDASEVVTIATEYGPVTTDGASLGQEESGDDGQVEAALVQPVPRSAARNATITVTLQARIFTTSAPPGEEAPEGGATTTTAPGATTTTTASPGEEEG